MKDTDKVELTVGDIKRGAEKCGTAKEILKELFPEVFKVSPPTWEDITKCCGFKDYDGDNSEVGIYVPMNGSDCYYCPFIVVPNPEWRKSSSGRISKEGNLVDLDGAEIKLENGLIWRRKSA